MERGENYIRSGLPWKVQNSNLPVFLHVWVCFSYKYALGSVAGRFWLHVTFRQVEKCGRAFRGYFSRQGKKDRLCQQEWNVNGHWSARTEVGGGGYMRAYWAVQNRGDSGNHMWGIQDKLSLGFLSFPFLPYSSWLTNFWHFYTHSSIITITPPHLWSSSQDPILTPGNSWEELLYLYKFVLNFTNSISLKNKLWL